MVSEKDSLLNCAAQTRLADQDSDVSVAQNWSPGSTASQHVLPRPKHRLSKSFPFPSVPPTLCTTLCIRHLPLPTSAPTPTSTRIRYPRQISGPFSPSSPILPTVNLHRPTIPDLYRTFSVFLSPKPTSMSPAAPTANPKKLSLPTLSPHSPFTPTSSINQKRFALHIRESNGSRWLPSPLDPFSSQALSTFMALRPLPHLLPHIRSSTTPSPNPSNPSLTHPAYPSPVPSPTSSPRQLYQGSSRRSSLPLYWRRRRKRKGKK